MKNYTDIQTIENYLLQGIDLGFEPQVEAWIEAMENQIDKETGRNFVADAAASERLFDGDGDREIFIDDCVEIEKVEVDGAEVDYFAYPANETPKIKIAMEYRRFTRGRQNVAVTAKWGYSAAVPADIKFACTVLVAGIINEGANSEGEVGSITMGRYNVVYRKKEQIDDFNNIGNILKKYQRYC
jgi:hypothetical protein